MPPVLFALDIFGDRASLFPQDDLDYIPLFYTSYLSCDNRHTPPHPAFSVKMRYWKLSCPGWAGTMILLISDPYVSWNDRSRSMPPYPPIDWSGVSRTFCLDWPQTTILPTSASQVTRITDKSVWDVPKILISSMVIVETGWLKDAALETRYGCVWHS
jgi:hypothetical protein